MISNIKDLKECIKDLPDDMLVRGCNETGNLYSISTLIISEDTLTEQEIKEGYPNGVTPTLVISVD
jgi:hypothetical protein